MSPQDDWSGRRVLVTGGAGFIGSHLVVRLVSAGAEVRVLDDCSTGHVENLAGLDVEVRIDSVLDPAVLHEAAEACHAVFHLAAFVSVPASIADPTGCFACNVTGTSNALQAALAGGAGRFVFASSSSIYGDTTDLPSHEDHAMRCRSPYAASKASAEGLVGAFGRSMGLSTISLRYFNVFGPRQDPHSPYAAAITSFARALRTGEAPVIFGDGTQSRDFTPVGDVVEATLRAGSCSDDPRGAIVNIGAGKARTLLEVLETMGRLLDVPVKPRFEARRAGDVDHSLADRSRARDLLGWEPTISFEDGLQRTLEALRSCST